MLIIWGTATGVTISYSSMCPPSLQQQGAGNTSHGNASIIGKSAGTSTGYHPAYRENSMIGFLPVPSSLYPGLATSTQMSVPGRGFWQPVASSLEINQQQVFNGGEKIFQALSKQDTQFPSNNGETTELITRTTSAHLQHPVSSNSFVAPLDLESQNIFGPNHSDLQSNIHGLPFYTTLGSRLFPPNVQLADESFCHEDASTYNSTPHFSVHTSHLVPSISRQPPLAMWNGSSTQKSPSQKTPARKSARSTSNGRSRPPTTPTSTKVSKRSSGVKLNTPRTPRPTRPGNRRLLVHELRLLMRFYPIAKPSTPLLSSDEELEKWFDSWAISSYNEDLYKSWARFRNENSTAAERVLYRQSVDEYEATVANYPTAMRAWNKRNDVAARHDSNLKAAQEAQSKEWGETGEEKREKWRLHGLNARDAAEVESWLKPIRDHRLQREGQAAKEPAQADTED